MNHINATYPLPVKRSIDLLISIPLIIGLSPLFVLIWLAIKLTSRGPALFRQLRIGMNGVSFSFLKFRTMYLAAVDGVKTEDEQLLKLPHDPRVTPIGSFLRRTSLDELPQLFNVISGDMSLVGPRPLVATMYPSTDDPRANRRHSVPPGITGYWQTEARHLNTSIEMMYPYDFKYIDEASAVVDLKIILRTIPAILSGNGAW